MFFMAALALMCMISCKKNGMTVDAADGERVLLNVSVPVVSTRAVNVSDDSEEAVNSLQVFVFRKADGSLDAYASEIGGNSLEIDATVGQKEIVAITNAPTITGVTSYDVLKKKITFLKDNALGNFIMTGIKDVDVTTDMPSVEIEVTRRVARIYLASVANNFTSEAYRTEEFRIRKIYIINAVGNTGYVKDIPAGVMHNMGGLDIAQTDTGLKTLLQDEEVGQVVDYGKENSYTISHCFYCYPNAGTMETEKTEGGLKCTKLVIEATLGEKTYYYPVPIDGILANHNYKVTVNITRPGSEEPDVPVSFDTAEVTVKVSPWEDTENTDITI